MNAPHHPGHPRATLARALAAAAAAWALSLPVARAQTADVPAAPPAETSAPAANGTRPASARTPDDDAARSRGMPILRAEDRLLPPECLYTNSTAFSRARPDLYEALVKRYGEGWTHMHHFCLALRLSLEYHRRGLTPQRRATLPTRIVAEFDYVIRNSPPDFELLPMVLSRKIDFLTMTGRTRDAFETAAELAERFPDLADGHARLAAMLRRAGRTAEADAVLARARSVVANPADLDAAMQRLMALN
jgi:hypothetical protein